jgi:phosphohistidine phosphatase
MKLHLLRHAKTSTASTSGKDFDRELSTKGVAQGNLMGAYLKQTAGIKTVLCSSAARTRQTLDIVTYHKQLSSVGHLKELYLASRDQMLEILWKQIGDNDILLVGHNFGISDLATYLTDTRIELRTSEYVCIEFEGLTWQEISRATGTITAQYRPRVFVP